MFNEENKEGMKACPQCGCSCQGRREGKMGMWMHMPKEFKIAKLEKKEQIMKAELEFIGKMREMVKNKPEEKK